MKLFDQLILGEEIDEEDCVVSYREFSAVPSDSSDSPNREPKDFYEIEMEFPSENNEVVITFMVDDSEKKTISKLQAVDGYGVEIDDFDKETDTDKDFYEELESFAKSFIEEDQEENENA
jgi:hypothetical protein